MKAAVSTNHWLNISNIHDNTGILVTWHHIKKGSCHAVLMLGVGVTSLNEGLLSNICNKGKFKWKTIGKGPGN